MTNEDVIEDLKRWFHEGDECRPFRGHFNTIINSLKSTQGNNAELVERLTRLKDRAELVEGRPPEVWVSKVGYGTMDEIISALSQTPESAKPEPRGSIISSQAKDIYNLTEQVKSLKDTEERRSLWRDKAKKQWGVDDDVSFDDVWAECLTLKQAAAELRHKPANPSALADDIDEYINNENIRVYYGSKWYLLLKRTAAALRRQPDSIQTFDVLAHLRDGGAITDNVGLIYSLAADFRLVAKSADGKVQSDNTQFYHFFYKFLEFTPYTEEPAPELEDGEYVFQFKHKNMRAVFQIENGEMVNNHGDSPPVAQNWEVYINPATSQPWKIETPEGES